MREKLRLRHLGPRFARARFERLEADVLSVGRRVHPSLMLAARRMAEKPTGSFFLHGEYRSWKTYLAASQFNAQLDARWPELEVIGGLRFVSDPDLSRSLRDEEMDRGRAIVSARDIAAGRIVHLTIDDLGKRRVTPFNKDAYAELIDAVFRSDGQCGLTITSNLDLLGLAYDGDNDRYEPAMVRRITDLCEVLEVSKSEAPK